MKNILKSLKAKSHKGFTIIQLVIGMLIFVILTGIAFLGSNIYTQQANVTKTASDLKSYETAIEAAMLANSNIASGTTDPNGTAYDESDMMDAINDYLTADLQLEGTDTTSLLLDPWGNKYEVLISTNGGLSNASKECVVHIFTYGSDTATGGTDDCILVVQYDDGEVVSKIVTSTDYDAAEVVQNAK